MAAPRRRRGRGPRSGSGLSPLVAVIAGVLCLAASAASGALIRGAGNEATPVDLGWQSFSDGTRSPALDALSLFLNAAGSQFVLGVVAPVVLAIAFAAARRGWSATAVLLGGALSAPLGDAMKSQVLRPRAEGGLIGVSRTAYPSGHVANLTTMVVIVALLLAIRWVWVVGTVLVLAMAFSRTYLGVHWLTDDVGGVLLGAGLALVIWGALASRIRSEVRRP